MIRSYAVRASVFLLLLTILILPLFASAQFTGPIVPCAGAVATDLNGDGDTSDAGEEKCTICSIADLAHNVLNAGIYIAVFISAILFAWAGWKHVTAGGNAGEIQSARRIFTNVLIGLIIIIAGWLVVDTLMRTVLKEGDTATGIGQPWTPICPDL